MLRPLGIAVMTSLLTWTTLAVENPWVDKAPPIIAAAADEPTVERYLAALDAAYRADDWQAGARLADEARRRFTDEPRLAGPVARALWRAGRMLDAEQLVDAFPADISDPVALQIIAQTALARGDLDRATAASDRLLKLQPRTAVNLMAVIGARLSADRLTEAARVLEELPDLVRPDNGYPEIHFVDEFEGMAEFLRDVGPRPLNEITRTGSAALKRLLIGLPYCEVMINGHGPYTMIVDTGGSIVVSIDRAVADEIGLKLLAESAIRGVGGKDTSHQALVDELRIGEIVGRRVMARVFDVRKAAAFTCDGILGTGVFQRNRLTLDFAGQRLVVTPSATDAAPGQDVPVRYIGDAKPMLPVTVQQQPVTALLDSGADGIYVSPHLLRALFPDRELREIALGDANLGMMGVGNETGPGLIMGPAVDLAVPGRAFERASGLALDVLDTGFSPILGVQTVILIGTPAFRDLRSIPLDFPRSKLWIDWLD